MKLFALDDEVAALQQALPALAGLARVQGLVALAWHLRQRDCAQALALADEAQAMLVASDSKPTLETRRCQTRLLLLGAEVKSLFAELDDAEAMAAAATRDFEQLGDLAGAGDGQWLLASIWAERGNRQQGDLCLEQAAGSYTISGDALRLDAVTARRLYLNAFRDIGAARAGLAKHFDLHGPMDASVLVWVASAQAVISAHTADPGAGIAAFLQVWQAGQDSGQLRQAIVCGGNAADNFATLGDLDTALEWDERAMALARSTGWPGVVGASLMQTGNVLRLLGRHEESLAMLEEAMRLMKPLTASRNYAVCLGYLGELALDMDRPGAALDWFRQHQEVSSHFNEAILTMVALRGQAKALSRLGQPQQASIRVSAALTLARQHGKADDQIAALRACAELVRQHGQPLPEGLDAAHAELHYLEQALLVAATISGYSPPVEVLEEVARAQAGCGDFEKAYHFAQAAQAARVNSRLQEGRNRALAMRVRHETERAQAEVQYHRQLAKTEGERASALAQTSATLETLGQMGRDITASLNVDEVCATLHRHAKRLIDATAFEVYLLSPGADMLQGVFSIEGGATLPVDNIAMDEPTSFNVRCARTREDIVIDLPPGSEGPSRVPGTLNTLSMLFSPLLIGERLLGVMSVQSAHSHAYGERERSIFHSLCAYGAIALDNAAAYSLAEQARREADQALQALRDAQARLVQSEKLAALGKLVAGVSHELNTPLGNGLTAITSLRSALQEVQQAVAGGGIKRQMFEGFLASVDTGSELVLRSLTRSADLVSTFKQLSDRTGNVRRRFRLQEVADLVVAATEPLLRGGSYRLVLQLPVETELDSYPEALANALQRLVDNAIKHGFDGRTHGTVRLSGTAEPAGWLHLRVEDDGQGIAPEHLPRIFDPFYTTRFGQGGSGLGLHLVHNTVTQLLGGSIAASSASGQGTALVLDLPLMAPGLGAG
jgi:signal transduction histidine kinase